MLNKSKYLHVVPRPEGFVLYHSLYGGLCSVDQNTMDLLNIFSTPALEREALNYAEVYGEEQVKSFIQRFKSKGFLIDSTIDECAALTQKVNDIKKHLHEGSQIRIVQLVLTNLCNFKCEYCFINDVYSSEERFKSQASSDNKIMSTENAQIYIEKIIEIVKKNGNKSLFVQFFGGEPLINWKVIKFVLEHFGRGEKYGIEITYSIVTNGSLFTSEIAAYCKNYDVAVIVSFDSPRGKARNFANGKNSIDEVEHNLSLLSKNGNRVVFNSVLSEKTFQYFDTDLVDFALKYYIFEIGVLLDLDPEFYEKHKTKDIVEKLWKVYTYGKQKGVLLTGYWHMIFQQMLNTNIFEVRGFKTCSATGCQLSVEPSGDVYACKGSSGYFGNILEPEELLSSKNYWKYALRTFQNATECDGCEIELFCSGFCLGPLEKKYRDIYVIEKNTCGIYKEITKRLIGDVEIDEIETYKISDRGDE
ncbi:MAG: radical SAM protein [Methanosarcina sp.]